MLHPLYAQIYTLWVSFHRLSVQLPLDESQGLLAVLVDILLVGVGIVSIAAIRISSVTVRLDDGGAPRRALESGRAGGELWWFGQHARKIYGVGGRM